MPVGLESAEPVAHPQPTMQPPPPPPNPIDALTAQTAALTRTVVEQSVQIAALVNLVAAQGSKLDALTEMVKSKFDAMAALIEPPPVAVSLDS